MNIRYRSNPTIPPVLHTFHRARGARKSFVNPVERLQYTLNLLEFISYVNTTYGPAIPPELSKYLP